MPLLPMPSGLAATKCREMLRLLDRLQVIGDDDERVLLIRQLVRRKRPVIVSFLNAHGFNLCWQRGDVRATFETADHILRDGVGLALGMTMLNRRRGLNMNGTDFIPDLLRHLPACRIAIFGTELRWLHKARRRLEAIGHQVVGLEHGFHEPEHYLGLHAKLQPDIVILAMGMPKQEAVAALLKRDAQEPVMILNGGAVIDFLGGKVPRAPLWVRRVRLEWLFRLAREPQRLARRYLLGNLQFVARIARLRLYQSQIESSEGYVPACSTISRAGSDRFY
jgi:exopolysaccharide biosynthesis WecB/TagA/CpsF family protein